MRVALTDPLLQGLVAGCAALVGVLAHEAGSPPFAAGAPATRRTTSADEIADLRTWTMPPASSFAATLERPLFVRSRRPAAVAATEGKVSAAATAAGPLELVLSGVVLSPSGSTALLEAVDSRIRFLSEGADVNGWTLTEITREAVVFTAGERSRRIVLKDLPEGGGADTPRSRTGAAMAAQGDHPVAAPNWTEESRRITPDGREIEVLPGFDGGPDDGGLVASTPVARIEQTDQ